MNYREIQKIAKEKGIKPIGKKKVALIREIQLKEGNFDCYGRAKDGYCDQKDCLWYQDCMEDSKTL